MIGKVDLSSLRIEVREEEKTSTKPVAVATHQTVLPLFRNLERDQNSLSNTHTVITKKYPSTLLETTLLGIRYLKGKGVEQDSSKAVELFEKSVTQQDPEALFWLGQCYQIGMGKTQNEQRAFEYYREAAKFNHVYALRFLGYRYQFEALNGNEDRKKEAFSCFLKAAQCGDVASMCTVGNLYLQGWGTIENIPVGLAWCKKGIEAGDSEGNAHLALAFYYFQKKPFKNEEERRIAEEKGVFYLKRAANQQNIIAMFHLGNAYQKKHYGLKFDLEKALYYFRKAKQNGHPNAEAHIQDLQESIPWGEL